jgi:hypothetical protein
MVTFIHAMYFSTQVTDNMYKLRVLLRCLWSTSFFESLQELCHSLSKEKKIQPRGTTPKTGHARPQKTEHITTGCYHR